MKYSKKDIENIYALTPMQEGMLFHAVSGEDNSAYVVQQTLYLKGSIDIALFKESIQDIIQRHQVFRTTIVSKGLQKNFQVVLKKREAQFKTEDITAIPAEQQNIFIAKLTREDKNRGFDLTKDMLIRFMLIKTAPGRFALVITNHHIIMDGWCTGIMFQDLITIYGAKRQGVTPKLPPVYPYSSYIKWLSKQDKEKAGEFWKNNLQDFDTKTELPFRGTEIPGGGAYEVGETTLTFSQEISDKIAAFASSWGTTLNSVLQGIWGLLLQRYNNTTDAVFGSVISGRPSVIPGVESIIGLFINTIPFRVRNKPDQKFKDWVKDITREFRKCENYGYHPLFETMALTEVGRDLISSLFVFENFPVNESLSTGEASEILGFSVTGVDSREESNYDINVICEHTGILKVHFSYNTLVFTPEAIGKIQGHFNEALLSITGNEDITIGEINILTSKERDDLLIGFNDTAQPYRQDATLAVLFQEQAEAHPERIALEYENQALTYRELNNKAQSLAEILQGRGLGPEKIAAILMESSIEMIVAILAVHKAGGAYVPVDPAYPEERITYMLEDSGSHVVLTNNLCETAAKGLAGYDGPVLDMSKPLSATNTSPKAGNNLCADSQNAAYIIYTSGSTGKPKGVVVEHKGVISLVNTLKEAFALHDEARFLQFVSPSFDASVAEIFPTLLSGCRLVLHNKGDNYSQDNLRETIKSKGITHAIITPAVLALLEPEGLTSMETIITGGDVIQKQTVEKWTEHCRMVDLYGPTENTVVSTLHHDLKKEYVSNIGRPIANTQSYILSAGGALQPAGIPGELCLGGDLLAREYLHRPDLTAEKFVNHPLLDGKRIYHSGDLAKWNDDGTIEFLGRIDHQVKIRGFRIETGEIEEALGAVPGVKAKIVVLKKSPSGEKYLAAYYSSSEKISLDEIKKILGKTLPEYMVPQYIIHMEELPLSPNGKIDRKALPDPEGSVNNTAAYTAPETELEHKIAAIWQEVLGIEKVGIDSSFFDLGGHSLKAVHLINRLRKDLEIELSLSRLFQTPTIRMIAGLTETGVSQVLPPIAKIAEGDFYPVSDTQKRLYILNNTTGMSGGSIAYNIPMAIGIHGHFDRQAIEDALNGLVARHETLRTSFDWHEGRLVQKIAPSITIPIETIKTEGRILDETIRDFFRPFDLHQAPLIRAGIVKEEQTHYLLLDMHHSISDGVSQDILSAEFIALYNGKTLPELPLQYKDFSSWQQDLFKTDFLDKTESYWLESFQDGLPLLELPLDFPRMENRSFHGKLHGFTLSKEVTDKLITLAGKTGITPASCFYALYALFLSKYTANDKLVLGVTVAGRPHKDLENMIGAFINFLPVQLECPPNQTFSKLAGNTNKVLMQSYDNQIYPFDKLVEKMKDKLVPGRNPLFDTMMLFHGQNEHTGQAPEGGTTFTRRPVDLGSATLDLKLDCYINPEGELALQFEYSTALFTAESIKAFEDTFVKLAAQIAENPAKPVNEYTLFTEEDEKELAAKRGLNYPAKGEKLAIAATFTAETMEPSLAWWADTLKMPLDIEFAPYNQVFQQLLDPQSGLSTNKDINLILLRFEDLIRDYTGPAAEIKNKLETYLQELLAILETKSEGAKYFATLFPVSDPLFIGDELHDMLEVIEHRWAAGLEKMNHVNIIDFRDTAHQYSIHKIFDPVTDKAGHIPFTKEFFAAMGTVTARILNSWKQNPFKVIVLDCDNTLWQGICGEDGPEGVKVTAPFNILQKKMVKKIDEGMLLALCSKNNEQDAWEVFEKNPGMVLTKDHIAAHKINWLPKYENIKSLAAELNLGLDSFIFIDDNPLECSGMMEHCPEVLTLQLPENTESIPHFLTHIWALDTANVTDEDRKRTAMYKAEQKRKDFLQGKELTLTDFLGNLELKMGMNRVKEEQIDRISQLTQRTNQFNMSTIRRTETDIAALVNKNTPETEVWAIEVRDKFGDYGLSGALITKIENNILEIDTLLLSCRVLGRNIEYAMLEGLYHYCDEQGIESIRGTYIKTERNTPVYTFLESLVSQGWEKKMVDEKTTIFAANKECWKKSQRETAPFIKIFYNTPLPEPTSLPAVAAPTSGNASTPKNRVENIGRTAVASPTAALTWNVAVFNERNLLHRSHLTALEYHKGEKLVSLGKIKPQRVTQAAYRKPETGGEQQIAGLFREILHLTEETKIGALDNFFDLGGNSLMAATLISRIFEKTGKTLNLREIFLEPTVHGLANLITRIGRETRKNIPKAEIKPRYHVTSQQKRLYLLQQIDPQSISYNTTLALELNGTINIQDFETTFDKIIHRHEAFRTTFTQDETEIYQHIAEKVELTIHRKKCIQKDIPGEIQNFIRPFDLKNAPLVRIALFTLSPEKHMLLIDTHHIIVDGVSFTLLIEDFGKLYNGLSLTPLHIQYKDYAEWQHKEFRTGTLKEQETYWLNRFKGELPVLNLPTDSNRPRIQQFQGDRITLPLGLEISEKLKQISRDRETTLYMVLLSAFKILLSKYTSQEDIIIGTGVAGRNHYGTEPVVGMFVNTLPIRSTITGDTPFSGYLKMIKEITLEALENQDYPFESLVEKLEVTRDMSRNPLFDVMFMFQNMQIQPVETSSLEIHPLEVETTTTKFDLTLVTYENKEGLSCSIEYSTSLFKEDTILRMAEHFTQLLSEIANAPETKINNLSLVTPEERATLLTRFNKPEFSPTIFAENTITAAFEAQVEKNPHAPAVEWEDTILTYSELNTQAEKIAHILRAKKLGPEKIAAVMMDNSIGLVTSILAILKSGGAYLPVDPDYPEDRISYMLEDSGAELVLMEGKETKVPGSFKGEIIDITTLDLENKNNNLCPRLKDEQGNRLAYLIYTSGSTGRPKGVVIEHRSALNMVSGISKAYSITEKTNLLQFASPSFDASAAEIFTTLLKGGKLVIFNRRGGFSEETLRDTIISKKVTNMTLPPVVLSTLHPAGLDSLETVITAGDTITAETADLWSRHTTLINGYGPTENTVCISTNGNLTKEAPSNIGKPIENVLVYIVDKELNLLPVGIPGELCVSGASLARGYLNRPDLTAEKFVPNPFHQGTKMYRTGDLARWKNDGTLEFMGRIDHQVKIRGYRIEIGEIESILSAIPGLTETVVIPQKDKGGDKYLAAYYTSETELSREDIKKALTRSLPEYMVPQFIIHLDKMPVTPNGKIDKKGLPKPETALTHNEYRAPRTEAEKRLAAIWLDILGIEKAGITDSYFDLGGHSLNATTLVSRIRTDMEVSIPLADIFQYPTIESLAAHITTFQKEMVKTVNPEDSEKDTREPKTIPLLTKQAEFLGTHLERLDPEWCNVGDMFELTMPLDPALAERALDLLCVHHEGLRSSFVNNKGEWEHRIAGSKNFKLFQEIDLSGCPVDKRKETVEKYTVEIQKKLTLSQAPLFKMTVFYFGEDQPRHLYLTIKHIIMDTYSISIMIDDFISLYTALTQGTQPALPAHTTTLEDWARELDTYAQSEELKAELPYWQNIRWDKIKQLPADFEDRRMKNTIGSFKNIKILFTEEETRELIGKTRREYGSNYINALYMALTKTITSWTGGSHIEITSVLHGRDMIPGSTLDVSRTISWFASNSVVVLENTGEIEPQKALASINRQIEAIPNKGYGYEILTKLTRDKNSYQSLEGLFKGELIFNYAGEFSSDTETEENQVFKPVSDYDLIWINQENPDLNMLFNIIAAIDSGKLSINWGYSANVHKEETVEKLASRFKDYVLELL